MKSMEKSIPDPSRVIYCYCFFLSFLHFAVSFHNQTLVIRHYA